MAFPRSNRGAAVSNSSPRAKRWIITMSCALFGIGLALYISSMENNAIETATLETHLKHSKPNVSQEELKEQIKRMKALRKKTREYHEKNKVNITSSPPPGPPPTKPTRIAVIGERHSGTRWISSLLQNCFHDNLVVPRLTRWKHLFQDDFVENKHPTLVVALFRNPYDWLEAMRKVPHNAPNHLYLDWKEFLTKEWTMDHPKEEADMDLHGKVCVENFSYEEVISCLGGHSGIMDGKRPMYELKRDKSGTPYRSILELRAAKINNFLEVKSWSWVKNLIPVQYEKLVNYGTKELISQIEKDLGIKGTCLTSDSEKDSNVKRNFTKEFAQYVDEKIDWDTETKIGYSKRSWINDDQIVEEVETKKDEESSDEEEPEESSDEEEVKESSDEEEVKESSDEEEVEESSDEEEVEESSDEEEVEESSDEQSEDESETKESEQKEDAKVVDEEENKETTQNDVIVSEKENQVTPSETITQNEQVVAEVVNKVTANETTSQKEQAAPIKIDYLSPSETTTQNEQVVAEVANKVAASGTTTQNEQVVPIKTEVAASEAATQNQQNVVEETNDKEVDVKEATNLETDLKEQLIVP